MFHFLVKSSEPEMLNAWLLPTTNYFSDGTETSPMSLTSTSVTCASELRRWLGSIDNDTQHSIYSGFTQKEFLAILKLPLVLSKEICDDLTFKCSDMFNFNTAKI
jgi:hypothetical protein